MRHHRGAHHSRGSGFKALRRRHYVKDSDLAGNCRNNADGPCRRQDAAKDTIAFSTALPGLGSLIPRVAERFNLMSGGTLRMKVYEPGKLVPPFEILDAVSSGKINSGYTTAGYWAGKIPAAPLFSAVPFGPEAGEYMAWLYYGNGMTLYQEMYDQVGFVQLCPTPFW